MNVYSPEDLKEILRLHSLWLRGDKNGQRADLSGADLSRANLSSADLYRANLSGADLYRANLSSADLSRADLSRADLSRANLSSANLFCADLSRADLSSANLSSADLPTKVYQFSAGKHSATAVDGYVRIGCKYLTVQRWLEEFENIGKDNNYTEEQIKDYGDFIKWYAKKVNKQ